jgi:phage repressor protein C with HTH and peptisase S24 domain
MKTNAEIRRDNLAIAVTLVTPPTAAALAEKAGVSAVYLSQVKNRSPESKTGKPKAMGDEVARKIEIAISEAPGWMDRQSGFGPSYLTDAGKQNAVDEMRELEDGPAKGAPFKRRRMADFDLVSADDTDGEVGEIEYWDVRGSCGGGFLNEDRIPKGHLVKEASFFHKYNVRPEDLFSIYADGDSMADFIVDGDIVIFDKRHKEPRSGKIYAIDHPDGLKIKLLRRGIDGSWTLESKNIDKRMYPDERIELGQQDLLKVHGEFIYRQGG